MTITQTNSAPLIAVVGATGAQGGSVIKALSESDRPYRIRGFTRDVTKATSQALKHQGVVMIAVNLVVENREQVYKVFAGADYVFLVTNYWEHLDMQREIAEGKMLIDAAKTAGVKGIVWSGLGKAIVTEYGRASGVPFVTVQAGLYASSFLKNPMMLAKQPDETYAIRWLVGPKTIVPVIDAENDYGLYVRRVLEQPVFPDGTDVSTSGEEITVEEMARQLAEVTGKKVVFQQITKEEFVQPIMALGMPSHVINGVVSAFQFWEEFGYHTGDAITNKDGLARPPRTWVEFVKHADWSKALA
ncbi:NAD(P)-binding protein [Mycena albidolilacea]|uniref:NAD(P)-binding protein n=1 Tax=Mycena albidolilacea TaxID=1033008 RepID=A0AAD6ZB80_9AGAR|nr:NAD(P)-binding protein [Mycena albidolilacea]